MTYPTRRQFGQTALAFAAAAAFPWRAGAEAVRDLVAEPGMARLAPADYPETAIWGYGGQVPGPMIRVGQGARVARHFINRLPQGSSIHWHGIRIDNAMDGVAGLTQAAVAPEASFAYDFSVPDAGTYWYHPHNRTWEQMARGLYGALIVDEAGGAPEADAEHVLLLDDWRLTDAAQIAGGFSNLHDLAHAGRIGNWITVNGADDWRASAARHSRLRLRLVNTANARVFALESQGLEGWVAALDGMPLQTPQPLGRLTLAPAQRVDLIVDVVAEDGGEALLISHERGGGYAIASFAVEGVAAASRRPAPEALPPNPVPGLGALATARKTDLLMEGGAMGRMQSAMLGGKTLGARELAGQGKAWAFNAMAEMPAEPWITADRGETVRIAIVNDTAWPHAMHLHGHHFRQVRADETLGPLRDTLLMQRGETAEIAFVADNPGDWLLHCHMLAHAASGMTTWLRVA